MKFLCPSCKAKYQIADEKVSGRAVRMKCRKCGYIIPISEVPPAPPTIAPPGGPEALPPVPRPPAAPRGLEPPPSSRPAPTPLAAPSVRPAPSPKPGAVRPGSPGVLATKKGIGPVPVAPPVTKVAQKGVDASTRAKARSASELLSAFEDEEEQATAIVSGGALAAAFGALVAGPAESKPTTDHAMPGDEWYAGINDVPVGPIRLAEIRAKAASGAIRGDTLVWRDGLEDWRPFRTFPELMAVLEESLSSVRAAGTPFPVPVDGAAGKADFGDFGTPLPSGVTGVGVVTDDLAAAGLARSRTPLVAWLAVFVALAGGLGLGYVFFSKRQQEKVVYRYKDRPTEEAPAPVAAGAQDPATVVPGADSAGSKPRPGGKGAGSKQVAATNGDKGGGLPGLKGLDGLRPGGPGPGSSPGSTTPAGGGGQLDSGQIQATVSRYTGSVKRSCWQPALDSKDPTAPASARVQVTINVGPTGSVQSATTNGDPRGYPGLANCIAGRVRSWQFPPSGGSTTAVVPFVFAAQ